MIEVINISKINSIVGQYIAEMRDKDYQQNRLLFRNNIRRVGWYEAFEVSKQLDYETREVELHFFACDLTSEPQPRLGQEIRWVTPEEIGTLEFPPADAELETKPEGTPRSRQIEPICGRTTFSSTSLRVPNWRTTSGAWAGRSGSAG